MTKKEVIWREIIFQATERKKIEFTQKGLAEKYGFSLSTVFNALKTPRNSGIIEISGRGFRILDLEKFLYLWATFRNMGKDIIYQTRVDKNVRQIEGEMPAGIIFGAFSAYYRKYDEAPADYDKVYIYAQEAEVEEVKKRFPAQKGSANLFVLKMDDWLSDFGQITSDGQTFVDLWNLSEWYAKDFLEALKEKILK